MKTYKVKGKYDDRDDVEILEIRTNDDGDEEVRVWKVKGAERHLKEVTRRIENLTNEKKELENMLSTQKTAIDAAVKK